MFIDYYSHLSVLYTFVMNKIDTLAKLKLKAFIRKWVIFKYKRIKFSFSESLNVSHVEVRFSSVLHHSDANLYPVMMKFFFSNGSDYFSQCS